MKLGKHSDKLQVTSVELLTTKLNEYTQFTRLKRISFKVCSDFCQRTHLSAQHTRPNIQQTGSAAACWSFNPKKKREICSEEVFPSLPQSLWLLLFRTTEWHPYSEGVAIKTTIHQILEGLSAPIQACNWDQSKANTVEGKYEKYEESRCWLSCGSEFSCFSNNGSKMFLLLFIEIESFKTKKIWT